MSYSGWRNVCQVGVSDGDDDEDYYNLMQSIEHCGGFELFDLSTDCNQIPLGTGPQSSRADRRQSDSRVVVGVWGCYEADS